METGVSKWYKNKEGRIIRFKVYKELSNMYVNYERGEVKMEVYRNPKYNKGFSKTRPPF